MKSFGATEETWTPPDPDLITSLTFGVVHVSSLMRRSVWEAVGGFDEAFSAQEDLDFWTRVMAHGVQGRVLPHPLFWYRVRPRSNYSGALEPSAHRALMTRYYEKHRELLSPRTVELLVAKERFLLEQRTHHAGLLEQSNALREELQQVEHAIADVTERLKGLGLSAVDLGDLRRTSPISPVWGTDRGLPLDRYYIHGFLERHRSDVRGHVLEIKDRGYTTSYGGDRVEVSDVLDIDPANDCATIVADLTNADAIRENTYDCIILTQTLGLIRDVAAAIREVHRILKPGGVVLCTLPAAGRISCEGTELDSSPNRFRPMRSRWPGSATCSRVALFSTA
jgi:SAM-dependent methyltransferase